MTKLLLLVCISVVVIQAAHAQDTYNDEQHEYSYSTEANNTSHAHYKT